MAGNAESVSEADFTPFSCAAIIGVGMMGGSLGLALKERGLARTVIGIDSRLDTVRTALRIGAIDSGRTAAVLLEEPEPDLIVLAVPVRVMPEVLEEIAPRVRPDALITDLGSTKGRIVEVGTRLFGERFVGGHPMAGAAESGIGAARSGLFESAAWAIARPEPFVPESDLWASRLAALVTSLGARPIPLDAARHDRLVALVSHLPHVLSFAFAQTVAATQDREQARALAGGSYRDLMRVSAADPALWRDIFAENRDALLDTLSAYEIRLQALKVAIASGSPEDLLAALTDSQESSPSTGTSPTV